MNKNRHDQAPRLGIRAHDLGCFMADELARRVSSAGFQCVQLALGKAVAGVDLSAGRLDSSMIGEVAAAFARHRVGIEVLGCYINPIHPDPVVRRGLHDLFKDHLRHARGLGCNIVALESGSLNGDYSYHSGNDREDAFQKLLEAMRELVDEARRCGVVIGIEAVTSHVVSTPEKMRRLLDEIASPHLKVVFDPVNLLNAMNFPFQRDVMRRALDLLGNEIVVVHAKDFRIECEDFITCQAGAGALDYGMFLPWFMRHKPGIAVLLEEAGVDHAVKSRDFVVQEFSLPIS